jgi:hypothetical protein
MSSRPKSPKIDLRTPSLLVFTADLPRAAVQPPFCPKSYQALPSTLTKRSATTCSTDSNGHSTSSRSGQMQKDG